LAILRALNRRSSAADHLFPKSAHEIRTGDLRFDSVRRPFPSALHFYDDNGDTIFEWTLKDRDLRYVSGILT
jgi:hypothetical protein